MQSERGIFEYDKLHARTIEVKDIGRQRMKEIQRNVSYGNGTVRVILQFPDESEDAMKVRETVRSILMMELEKQIKMISLEKGRSDAENADCTDASKGEL